MWILYHPIICANCVNIQRVLSFRLSPTGQINPHVVFRFSCTPVCINTGKVSLHIHRERKIKSTPTNENTNPILNNLVFISMGFLAGHSILSGRRLAVHMSFRFSSYFRLATAADGSPLCSALNETLLIEGYRRKHLVSDEVSLDLKYH